MNFTFRKLKIQNYKTLPFLLKIIFTFSHERAAVERGFNINQQLINQNMESEAIIARRFIKDRIILHGLTQQSICIDSSIIKLVKSTGVEYKF